MSEGDVANRIEWREDGRVCLPSGEEGIIHLLCADPGWAYVLTDDGDYRLIRLEDLRMVS